MVLRKVLATNNRCYITNNKMKPIGIVVHSTGANNPNLRRYVAPDDGYLGTPSSEHWNQSKTAVCVHAFIGKLKDGSIATYQILPFDVCCWGCGSGSRGSYNASHIQFEICEDGLADANYFNKVYTEAVEFCAYLCQTYGIKVSAITTHCDAHKAGYASNHADVMHWFPRYGKNMDTFRADVQKKLNGGTISQPTQTATPTTNTSNTSSEKLTVGVYRVDSSDGMNIRKGPGTNYGINTTVNKGEAFTIVEMQGTWGRLKSGAGWMNCASCYCTKIKDTTPTQATQTAKSFMVRVICNDLNIRKGPGMNYDVVGCIRDKGSYTIVAEQNRWGKLKSGAGWICIDAEYVKRL